MIDQASCPPTSCRAEVGRRGRDIPRRTQRRGHLKKIADFWNTGLRPTRAIDATTPSGGPYHIDEFKPGESLTLIRNDKFWGPAGPGRHDRVPPSPTPRRQPQALANNEVQVISPQPNEDLVPAEEHLGRRLQRQGWLLVRALRLQLQEPAAAGQGRPSGLRPASAPGHRRHADQADSTANVEVLNNRMFFPFQSAYKDNAGGSTTSRTSPRRSPPSRRRLDPRQRRHLREGRPEVSFR